MTIRWKTEGGLDSVNRLGPNVVAAIDLVTGEINQNRKLIFEPMLAPSLLSLTVTAGAYTFAAGQTVQLTLVYEYNGDNTANSVDDIMSVSTPSFNNSPGDLQIPLNSSQAQGVGDYDFTAADILAGFVELSIVGTGTVGGDTLQSNTVVLRLPAAP